MKKHLLLCSFVSLVVLLSLSDTITEDRDFSDLENRKLSQKVEFSFEDFWSGDFQSDYESYVNDQFIVRDTWIDIKARAEYALGKVENNGMFYGDDEYLFQKFTSYEKERLDLNIEAINIFKEKIGDTNLSVMIAPNSYEIYSENLPLEAPVVNQKPEIDYIYDNLININNLNIIDLMIDNKEDYIYYRTDHHWSTQGAYLAYKEFAESINIEPVDTKDINEVNVEGFYGTYFSKAKPFNVEGDSLTYYELDNLSMEIYGETFNSIYDYEMLKERDKYSTFINGNNALTVIKNSELRNGEKILVIKDSFANSFVPFLTQNYEEVHVIDLRTFREKPYDYVNNNNFDEVLILYNFITFSEDVDVLRLKY